MKNREKKEWHASDKGLKTFTEQTDEKKINKTLSYQPA